MNETMTDRELDAYLAEHLWGDTRCRRCGRRFSFHPWDGSIDGNLCLEPQPYAYSSTGEGMLMVIEAMRERGDAVEIVCPSALAFQVTVYQSWGNGDRRVRSESPSLPRAVAEAAARSALESGA